MTRWAMAVDLRRCVGCQTCTASCKHANATPPGVQWRRVLDIEVGEYPDVQRAFVPVGCNHCDEPACLPVCPTGATYKRPDGIVHINYDACIGCAYCAVACPYQARSKTDLLSFAYGGKAMANETARSADREQRRAVATKCTFCVDRIDAGLAAGQTPGVHPEATPACVNSCIAEALAFGDIEDPQSNVSHLLANNQHFRMHEELGTGPGIFYLWDRKTE
ncbi:MAG TPA: 4Fe-4S dicluster domain-containing protein [Ramlibacter sp.]